MSWEKSIPDTGKIGVELTQALAQGAREEQGGRAAVAGVGTFICSGLLEQRQKLGGL